MTIRQKLPLKCDCGDAVFPGSVFCPHCWALVNRENARVIKREEKNYQKSVLHCTAAKRAS